METMIDVPTYCGLEVTGEYAKIPAFFFREVENYYTKGYCCGSVEFILKNDFIMGVCNCDNSFDKPGVLRAVALFIHNRCPKYNNDFDKVIGDKDTVEEFIKNGTRFTREQLIQVSGLAQQNYSLP